MKSARDSGHAILHTSTRNKSRILLTACGVFWGILMLMTLMGGGQGLEDMMKSNFQGFATNSGFIFTQRTSEAYKGFSKGRSWNMDQTVVVRIRQMIPALEVVSPLDSRWGATAVYEDKNTNCNTKGLYPEYAQIEAPTLSMGRYLNEIDCRELRKVCVSGKRIYESFFPHGENPLGKLIEIAGTYFQIISVALGESHVSINGSVS